METNEKRFRPVINPKDNTITIMILKDSWAGKKFENYSMNPISLVCIMLMRMKNLSTMMNGWIKIYKPCKDSIKLP